MGRVIKGWQIVASYVEGRLHEQRRIGCQDRVSYYRKDGKYCVALADGAGFSDYSQKGAQIVAKNICRYIVRNFDKLVSKKEENIKEVVKEAILRLLSATAKAEGIEIRLLASTLLCVAFNKNEFLSLHMGDGVIGVLRKEEVLPFSLPDNDEFVNVTCFTTSSNFERNLRVSKGKLDDIQGFILMSDGTAEALYHRKKQEFALAVKKIFNWFGRYDCKMIKKALDINLGKMIRNFTYDDCSIIVVKRI